MVTLVVLDGFGISKNKQGNAIKLQGTPCLDKLNAYSHTVLHASGERVGLTAGQMGNSEVGHLNLGAGKVVYQDLPRINNAIADKSIFKNENLNRTMQHVLENNSTLHLIGLLSNGGVHSHINHLKALIDMASEKGLTKVCIHAITDGRDTLRNSGHAFLQEIEEYANGKAVICSIIGRVYAMDRESRWDRIEKAYDMLVLGKAENYNYSWQNAISESYSGNVFDEFIEPTIIGKAQTINSGDGVIFFNYRTDRTRELTKAIIEKDFNEFERKNLNNVSFCCMTEYSSDFKNVIVAFEPQKITDNLSAIISSYGLKQFHISETTKYAHVTFFFNGGIEKPNALEERKLIESENVKDFSETPKMKAYEITEEVITAIADCNYDFILVNLSNADMIGHTGNLKAAKTAISVVDKCAYAIALATLAAGGDCIITADHGNAEEMLDKKGNVLTQHTTNLVPIWLISNKHNKVKLNANGSLANVAPTVLKLLNISVPEFMEQPLF